MNPVDIKKGLFSGLYKKGTFRSSRDNYLEGEVMVEGLEKPVFIQG